MVDLGTIEEYDSSTNSFIYQDLGTVRFEYSLKAIYNWEGKWKKPFLTSELSDEESRDLYRLMALDPLDDEFLTYRVMKELSDYISNSNTATSFGGYGNEKTGSSKGGKFLTTEEIYANMFAAGIPLEFENRNLNRLFVVLKIISLNNEAPKKMTKNEILRQNASLNEQRKAALKTKG